MLMFINVFFFFYAIGCILGGRSDWLVYACAILNGMAIISGMEISELEKEAKEDADEV